MKETARLGDQSSAFDGRVLLGLDTLGLNPVSQEHVTAGSRAGVWLIGCEPADGTARYCRECGAMGRVRSSWRRRFVHTPIGQHAVHLIVRVRRYECMACARSWTDDLTHIAGKGRRLTDAAVWWVAAEVVLKSKSVSACAHDLHCSWGALNRAVLEKGTGVLAADPRRLDGVETIGVEEHVWRHTAFGSRYAAVIVDLTPQKDGPAGPSVLLQCLFDGFGSVFPQCWLMVANADLTKYNHHGQHGRVVPERPLQSAPRPGALRAHGNGDVGILGHGGSFAKTVMV